MNVWGFTKKTLGVKLKRDGHCSGLLIEDSCDAIGFDGSYPLTSERPPLIQLNVDDPEYCRIFTSCTSAQYLADLLRVGGELTVLTVSFGELNADEGALGGLEDGADCFGGGLHGCLLWLMS
ncbi:hypothetical protein SCRES1_gp51 [Synechococcus phage S-CRES1]|nr:hypothetical protein SCRES1_gp51 [Synechococcus phage S-CRES1]